MAASEPERYRFIKQVAAVTALHGLDLGRVRLQHLETGFWVALAHLLDEPVGGRRQPQGVHSEHAYLGAQFGSHVEHCHPLGLEGRYYSQSVAKGVYCPSDDLVGLFGVELNCDLPDFKVVVDQALRHLLRFLSQCCGPSTGKLAGPYCAANALTPRTKLAGS